MGEKLGLRDLDVAGKRVLVRVDFNVLMEGTRISDDTRIRAALPTILHLIANGAKIILITHLGRPNGFDSAFSTAPVAGHLSRLMGQRVMHALDCVGHDVESSISQLLDGGILLLENVRFYKEETANNPEFAKELASLADIYVNDAFGTAHRAHASTEGVTRFFDQSAAGLLVERELRHLNKTLQNPERPFAAILGGVKISDKIGMIENLLDKVNEIIVGGKMTNTFLKAMRMPVGKAVVESENLEIAVELLRKASSQNIPIHVPHDHLIAKEFSAGAGSQVVPREGIPDGWERLDIGPTSIVEYGKIIDAAKTVFWNGPLGVYEFDKFSTGTIEIAKRIAESKAVSIIGGGDCVAAANKAGVADRITHVSTGGGATLKYLEGKALPGIAGLTDKTNN